jgi:hypothetical protein
VAALSFCIATSHYTAAIETRQIIAGKSSAKNDGKSDRTTGDFRWGFWTGRATRTVWKRADLPFAQPTKFELVIKPPDGQDAWLEHPAKHSRHRRQGDRIKGVVALTLATFHPDEQTVWVKSVVWTGGLPFPVLPREADCLAARRDFAFSPISAASQPFLLRALSYMRDLPRERAESQQIGVDGGGSKNRDLTLDPLKRGQDERF